MAAFDLEQQDLILEQLLPCNSESEIDASLRGLGDELGGREWSFKRLEVWLKRHSNGRDRYKGPAQQGSRTWRGCLIFSIIENKVLKWAFINDPPSDQRFTPDYEYIGNLLRRHPDEIEKQVKELKAPSTKFGIKGFA